MSTPITPAITSGAGAIADALRDGGVDTVFGLPGVHNLALWPACARAGVRIVGSRHEQGCAYAADGYARATGRTGVAFTTTGPGAANTLGAVGEAWASHSPVVVFASDIATTLRRPGTYRGVLHECTDQAALFAPVTKARLVAGRADDLGAVVGEALALANRAPRGPVYVGVPTDLLSAPIAGTPFAALHPTPVAESEVGPIAASELAELDVVLALLATSQRPLIWIGGGTRDAGPEVDAAARALGAPVIATFQARGVLPASHPLLVGAPPHEPQVTALVEQADFVLVVGSDLDHMNTMGWRLPLPPARAAINVEPHDATKNYEMNAVIEADAAVALRALTPKIAPRAPWIEDVPAVATRVRDELRADPEFAPAVDFLERTRAALPDDAVVFADMCIAGYWLSGQYQVECERGLHYPMGWGTLGFAFPASIGAAVAVGPQRPVVAVMGDGGMLFAIGELAAVAQERLALTVVVVDDGGYGMLRFGHEDEPDHGTSLSPVDFVAVAEGFGIVAEPVDGLGDDYGQALAKAVASGEPRLIHVHARLAPPRTTSPRWPLAVNERRT